MKENRRCGNGDSTSEKLEQRCIQGSERFDRQQLSNTDVNDRLRSQFLPELETAFQQYYCLIQTESKLKVLAGLFGYLPLTPQWPRLDF